MYKAIKNTKLTCGMHKQRYDLNRAYIMSLKTENLLQNHYGEAGLWNPWWEHECSDCHGGWESPASAIRGHYLGHWMSAAAKMYFYQNDLEARTKLDFIIDELERCQESNGGEWVHSCPEKYLRWLLDDRSVGVPQYNIHKTMMGLWDSYEFGGSEKALKILLNFTEYFVRFTDGLSEEKIDDILDIETGGMLEIFANVYNITKEDKHYKLMKKYVRRRLFIPLLEGRDALTNMHANTTIPEALGIARVYEVTGEKTYLDMVSAYWDFAVEKRGYYATGSANSGEIWCPPDDFASRFGDRNQEHCNQYNLIRLADFMFRQTGDKKYGDYTERSIYNSIFAQQNQYSGMVAYYLPLKPGGKKEWSTPKNSFWCCVGTLSQAHTNHPAYTAYQNGNEIIVSQYIGSQISSEINGKEVLINISEDGQGGDTNRLKTYDPGTVHKPEYIKYNISVKSECDCTLKMRIPWWAKLVTMLSAGGKEIELRQRDGYAVLEIGSGETSINIGFKREISLVKIPGNENLAAFMDGPYVLAMLDAQEIVLPTGLKTEEMLRPLDARNWGSWGDRYLLQLEDKSIPVMRLCDITDEVYTVYARVGNN